MRDSSFLGQAQTGSSKVPEPDATFLQQAPLTMQVELSKAWNCHGFFS